MSEIHTTFFNFSEVELLKQVLPKSDIYEFTSRKVFRKREIPVCTCSCKCVHNGYDYARKKNFGKVKIGKYVCSKCGKHYSENKSFWKDILAKFQEILINMYEVLRDSHVSYENMSKLMGFLIPQSKDKIHNLFNKKMDLYKYEVNETILIVHYDEQHPRRGRNQKFRLTLLNAKDRTVIADCLYENKDRETVKIFLLKHLDTSKDLVIITDCDQAYPQIFKELWGNRVRHQKCLLHLNKLICKDSGRNTDLLKEYNKYLLLNIFYNRSRELKKLERLMKKQEKKSFSSKKERQEWIRKAKKEFYKFVRKGEKHRRRKKENLQQRNLKSAEKKFSKILFEKSFFSKKLQKRINMIKENWKILTTFYHIKDCPATNNAIENYYSTSLKTHRKKQFRTDRGLQNQIKLAALKRHQKFGKPKETLFEIFHKIYLLAT